MFCMLKKKKYIVLMFQKVIQIVKSKFFPQWFQMEKDTKAKSEGRKQWHYHAVGKIICIIKRNDIIKIMMIFIVWIVFILLEQKNKLEKKSM